MTPKQYKEARERYEAGEALTKLAMWYGCCKKWLKRQLLADGVEIRSRHVAPMPKREAAKARLARGEDTRTIVEALGVCEHTVWRAMADLRGEQ